MTRLRADHASGPQPVIPASRDGSRVPPWLIDDYVEGYACWREECAAVDKTYDIWRRARRAETELAYRAYSAALDQEDEAARELGDRYARIRRWLH